jgi:hypothetical protein
MTCCTYHKYIFACILIMHMYVYCSYNQSYKMIFQSFKKLCEFEKNDLHLDFFNLIKNRYLSFKIVIPIVKHFNGA